MAQVKKKPSGQRPKHVPLRMCISCRRTDAKRDFFRLVRDAMGHVTVDATGKRAGRGAYLCRATACWDHALKRRGLERALRVESLFPEDRAALEQIAQELAQTDSAISAQSANEIAS
jgi:predicted RNA-binding protein YlxR (DUF448 family)